MRKLSPLILAALLTIAPHAASAGNGNDAVIGSIIGGVTGAVIGNGFGGRDGAIVGSALGAAAGVAIATDNNRNQGYNNQQGYQSVHRDDRYRDDRRYYDNNRYDNRRDYRYEQRREVVVVESPRHYYRGNEFVYGVPPRYDNRDQRNWNRNDWDGRDHRRHHHHDRGPNVVIIQPAPRYDDRTYSSRRW